MILRFSGVTEETRLRLQALSIVPVLDLVALLLVALLVLHGTARWLLIAAAVAVLLAVWVRLFGFLLRPHLLTEHGLVLRQGFGFRLALQFEAIAGVRPYPGVGPASTKSVLLTVDEEEQTVFCLMGRTGLTEVMLTGPMDVAVKGSRVAVSSVVLSLASPAAFAAAVSARLGGEGREPSIQSTTSATRLVISAAVPSGSGDPAGVAPAGLALFAQGLRKQYGGLTAVDGVTLRVPFGQIVGFLGSNGAGKTTTIRMIAGLLPPDDGTVTIAGKDAEREPMAARQVMGYVPDTPAIYDRLTGREYLWLVGELFDLPREETRDRAAELLDRLAIARAADRLAGTYSLGMKKKLSIAGALMHRPRLLLLDEPTNGLDPRSSYDVKQMIANLGASGVGVLLATHHLDVVEELCGQISIIDAGRLVATGSQDELRIRLGDPAATLEKVFLSLTAVS